MQTIARLTVAWWRPWLTSRGRSPHHLFVLRVHALSVGLSQHESRQKSNHCIQAAPYPAIHLSSFSLPPLVFSVPLSLRSKNTCLFIPRFLKKVFKAFICL